MKRVGAVIIAAALALAGCTGSGSGDASASASVGDIAAIEVGVSDTLAPSVTWPSDMIFKRAQSQVLWQGEGAQLQDGQPLLLDIYIKSLDTGRVLRNTYDGLPESTILAPEMLGDSLYTLLLTARVGTRVLSVSPPAGEFEDEPAIVVVIDVLSDRAVGQSLEQNPELPRVTTLATGEPVIDIAEDQTYPKDLTVSTLVQGEGQQVLAGSYIVANVKVVYGSAGSTGDKTWEAGDVRQTSWPPERRPFEGQIGVGKLPRAWDEGLVDQTAGSRVLLVAPEAWGYPGEGTLIYVIDILDVWNDTEGTAEDVLDLPDPSASAEPTISPLPQVAP